jgi:hypothetical protein
MKKTHSAFCSLHFAFCNRLRFSSFRRAILFALLLCTCASADSGWILTTADFKDQPVTLQSIDSIGVHVLPVAAGATPAIIPFDNFLQLDRGPSARAAQGQFVLHLAGGDQLTGTPFAFKDEQVLWRNPILGDLKIPLKDARALIRSGKSVENLDQLRTEDVVQMSNGDNAKGIVTDLSDSKIKINSNSNDIELRLDSIDWIQFAVAGKPKQITGRAFRVRLLDGSILTAGSVATIGEALAITLSENDKRSAPLASVAGIEQLNGPVSWLSSRSPLAVVQIPYYGTSTWPTRMDLSVGGKPIQFAGRTYARGIGVHSYSRLDYALDGNYEALRTQYAISTEDRRQYADVTVRIKLDGKIAHEQPSFRADVISPVVIVDVPKTAKVLTLEVDYGAANDVQDRFNWIEPALLRKKPVPPTVPPPPATMPSTRPATAPVTRPAK